jgi:hypothetical protein
MSTVKKGKTEIVMFLVGALSILMLFLLTGAGTHAPIGKYEIEIAHRGKTHLVYVMDTTTGAVKWVESMGTPFTELKGD